MTTAETYHSGLFEEMDLDGLDEYEADGNHAFVHDVFDGVDERFRKADAIWLEPAWQTSYEEFLDRVDTDTDRNYKRYVAAVRRITNELDLPAFMVIGRHNLSWFAPDDIHPIEFDPFGQEAFVALYNGADLPRYEVETAQDACEEVADTYDCVVDFLCGYGRLAKAMVERDKQFVCSDINDRCIHYIASEFMGYDD